MKNRCLQAILLSVLFSFMCIIALASCSKDDEIEEVTTKDDGTYSGEETNTEQMRQEIEQFLDDWNNAMIAADTARLGAMMDNDIILRHITGMTQTKREWLEEVASGSMTYHKIETRDVAVTFNSQGSAIVSFTSVITATIWGGYGTWTLSGKMRLVRRIGRWIRTE